MKKLLFLLSLMSTTSLFADGVVNVYSSRHYAVDSKLYEAFEKETGIKVNVINNSDVKTLIKKLKEEGKNTEADLFFTVGVGDLYQAKSLDLLSKINDKIIDTNVPIKFRDKDNYWIGLTYRARVFVYNPEKVKAEELSTYEDLANNPKWKGRVLTRSSSSSYNQHLIAFMISKLGDKKATEWAKNLVNNFARSPKGNDRDQAKAVVAGVGDVAIMNSYYLGNMAKSSDPNERMVASKVKLFFPDQKNGGTHINLSGVGITKYAKNKENALKLIEFLTSPSAQKLLAEENNEFPVNPKVSASEIVKSWGAFKVSDIDYEEIAKNLQKASSVAGVANWD